MKKGWKIALISLGSLLGLAIVVVAVALWLVFTPSQLTRIANRLADNYVSCDARFGRVNLTLFKTFPDAGLTIDDVVVVNPLSGAPTDTLASIGSLTVGLDVRRYLKEKEVVVHQVWLDRVRASLFVDSLGAANYDIFPHSDKEKDTTKSSFSLDSLPRIDLRKIKISHLDADYLDRRQRMQASVADLGLELAGSLEEGQVQASLDLAGERIALQRCDSLGRLALGAVAGHLGLDLQASGNLDRVVGRLRLTLPQGTLNANGTDMVNPALQASKHNLLQLSLPFDADLRSMHIALGESRVQLDDYALDLRGEVQLPTDSLPMGVDLQVATDGQWAVAPLLDLLPERYAAFRQGMELDARVKLAATAVGTVTDSTLPLIDATLGLANGSFHYPQALPYKIDRISGDLAARLDLGKGGRSQVRIGSLKAHTRGTDVSISGKVDDLLGDMHVDAALKGSLPLADAKPMLPSGLPLDASGHAALDLKTDFRMSQLKARAFDRMKASGTIGLTGLDVVCDSIHVSAPDLAVALQLPATAHAGKMADAHLKGSRLTFGMKGIAAEVAAPDINIGLNNPLAEQLAAAVELSLGSTSARIDSNSVSLASLALQGAVRMDSTQSNVLKKFHPVLDIDLHNGVVATTALPEQVYLSNFAFRYRPEQCEIRNAEVKLGRSDFQLYGTVDNLEDWMQHSRMLSGELNFVSGYTDVDQLMDMFSGMGSDPDTLAQMRAEDNVAKDANPFIVPRDVDLTLNTHIRRSVAFGNDLGDVAGKVTVKDGTAVLDQIGFACKAATMQLTALYRSPRPNNLFVALDFHLLDIQIDELLDMIPTIDTLVPMLAAFSGNADFHLAGEGFLNARYKPKMSTLLGSAAISGKDLVVMDNNSIAQIAKLMQLKSWKDKDNKIRIDSLSVEMTCLRKEIEVFPFLLNIGKYQICASGKHTLDNNCGYHIELLKNPLLAKVGVDVRGSLKKPQISLGEVRYADLYRPSKVGEVEKRTLEMKRMVREALESNVR